MPEKKAFADIAEEAVSLLAAVGRNGAQIGDLERHRLPVEQLLSEIRIVKAAQKTLIADKQKLTQDLHDLLRRLRDQMVQLRAAVRAEIGPRSEKLVEFGVAPLRRRRRSKADEPEESELKQPAE